MNKIMQYLGFTDIQPIVDHDLQPKEDYEHDKLPLIPMEVLEKSFNGMEGKDLFTWSLTCCRFRACIMKNFKEELIHFYAINLIRRAEKISLPDDRLDKDFCLFNLYKAKIGLGVNYSIKSFKSVSDKSYYIKIHLYNAKKNPSQTKIEEIMQYICRHCSSSDEKSEYLLELFYIALDYDFKLVEEILYFPGHNKKPHLGGFRRGEAVLEYVKYIAEFNKEEAMRLISRIHCYKEEAYIVVFSYHPTDYYLLTRIMDALQGCWGNRGEDREKLCYDLASILCKNNNFFAAEEVLQLVPRRVLYAHKIRVEIDKAQDTYNLEIDKAQGTYNLKIDKAQGTYNLEEDLKHLPYFGEDYRITALVNIAESDPSSLSRVLEELEKIGNSWWCFPNKERVSHAIARLCPNETNFDQARKFSKNLDSLLALGRVDNSEKTLKLAKKDVTFLHYVYRVEDLMRIALVFPTIENFIKVEKEARNLDRHYRINALSILSNRLIDTTSSIEGFSLERFKVVDRGFITSDDSWSEVRITI